VLVLHGAGGGYDQGLWAGRLAFGNNYQFIAVSRYGYLRTPIPQKSSIRTQAAVYKDLLDHLHVPRVIVLGISAGGPSATQFANDYPERTRALLLMSAMSDARLPGDKPPFYTGLVHLIQRSDYAYWLITEFLRPAVLDLMGVSRAVHAKLADDQKRLAEQMLALMHPMSQRRPGTVHDGNMVERDGVAAGEISAPTLVLHARDDSLVSYTHAEHAHRAITHSKLVMYEAGGHGLLPQMDRVRGDVQEFLANTSTSRPAARSMSLRLRNQLPEIGQ
jgi:pimeloyl-ACP methyl ester carboxylesterase